MGPEGPIGWAVEAKVKKVRKGAQMKPRKPDRWERMVLKVTAPDMCIYKGDAIKLLCSEHAWMRRMVRRCLKGATDTGYVIACSSILGQLDQRRK